MARKDDIQKTATDKKELHKYVDAIISARAKCNKKQEELRHKYNFISPQYVAHATHVSQEEYKVSVPEVYAWYSEEKEIVPAFGKGTQNEFNAQKDIFGSLNEDERKVLEKMLPSYPKRVFAINTKQDSNGNAILDETGKPVPQDATYAYSLKKCSASIHTVDGDIPLLIGFEEKYKDFERGKIKGHIYIGRGTDFKAEYDEQGNITEYTSSKDMIVTHHYETTPQEAMAHNVQLVMFKSEKQYETWARKVRQAYEQQGRKFATFISEDDVRIDLLKKEILAGNATYINATARGFNPKMASVCKAQEIADKVRELRQKLIHKNQGAQTFQQAYSQHNPRKLSLSDVRKIKEYQGKLLS